MPPVAGPRESGRGEKDWGRVFGGYEGRGLAWWFWTVIDLFPSTSSDLYSYFPEFVFFFLQICFGCFSGDVGMIQSCG